MPPETDARGSLTNLIRKLRFDHGEMTQQVLAEWRGCHAADDHRAKC